MLTYCGLGFALGIALQAHSPLGTPTRPAHYAKPDDPVIMEDPILLDVAKKHSVHPALVRTCMHVHAAVFMIRESAAAV